MFFSRRRSGVRARDLPCGPLRPQQGQGASGGRVQEGRHHCLEAVRVVREMPSRNFPARFLPHTAVDEISGKWEF